MDKALLRPLFRQTAIHTKQIETDSIPKYVTGGIMYGLGRGVLAGARYAS